MRVLKTEKQPTSFDDFYQDGLCSLFRFFTPTQLRTIAPVCRTWRRTVFERALPDNYFESLPVKLRDAEIFNKHPLNKARLMQSLAFEAGSSEGSFIELMTEPWELGAFNGLYDACAELLGENLLTQKRIDGATVMHLAAMGGQIDLLAKLSEDNKDILLCKDMQGNTLLDYASFFGQVECMAWLLENTSLRLDTANGIGFVCIDTFVNVKIPRLLILKLAFLLTNNYNNNALIDHLTSEQQEHIILTTKAYIASKTRSQEELAQINIHIKSSHNMMKY
ncbi:MAG: ankyrin repeat domain-containing protein [Gammaproteobacteria bacterium]|nr:ankyrin repeat domain-containing protein [Gammaproteobacteria bacterium]